jgi:hypothetical protein
VLRLNEIEASFPFDKPLIMISDRVAIMAKLEGIIKYRYTSRNRNA